MRCVSTRLTALVRMALVTIALAMTAVASCDSSRGPATTPREPVASGAAAAGSPSASASVPAAAGGPRTPVTVAVPAGLAAAPFDRPRQLELPAGWTATVYARVDKARFLTPTPNGEILVSQPSTGAVVLVRPGGSGAPGV